MLTLIFNIRFSVFYLFGLIKVFKQFVGIDIFFRNVNQQRPAKVTIQHPSWRTSLKILQRLQKTRTTSRRTTMTKMTWQFWKGEKEWRHLSVKKHLLFIYNCWWKLKCSWENWQIWESGNFGTTYLRNFFFYYNKKLFVQQFIATRTGYWKFLALRLSQVLVPP